MTMTSEKDNGAGSGKIFTEMIVIRHGQTESNREGKLQGHQDARLDAEGIRQAEQLADRLTGETFGAIYCSDLIRAVVTAEIIAARCGTELQVCPELREWQLGELENITYEEGRRLYPEIMEGFKYDYADIIIPGGESKQEFYRRAVLAMETIAAAHPGDRVLVVTHGGVLQAMLKHVLGADNCWRFLPRSSNTGYNKFLRRDGVWQLCCWNDTSHLDRIGMGDL